MFKIINFLFLFLFLLIKVNGIFFGGGGGCSCGQSCAPCAPAPSCGSPCGAGGGGTYYTAGGYTRPNTVSSGGSYAVSGPASVIGTIHHPVVTPNTGSYAVPGGTVSGGRLDGYISPTARGPVKSSPPPGSYHDPAEKDFYDDNSINTNLKFADVSATSKELTPLDIYKRRFLALKNLRHRRLRQFSAPNVPKEFATSTACNNEKLAKIMAKSIVSDISVSKRLVRKATELAFEGLKLDVFCAVGDFSYSIYAEKYCETTRGNVTCFAFA